MEGLHQVLESAPLCQETRPLDRRQHDLLPVVQSEVPFVGHPHSGSTIGTPHSRTFGVVRTDRTSVARPHGSVQSRRLVSTERVDRDEGAVEAITGGGVRKMTETRRRIFPVYTGSRRPFVPREPLIDSPH